MMNGRGRRRYGSAELGMDEPVVRQMDSDCTTRPNYIEHHVSKLDTLAGVAIKYGVEVTDIKRMNGLVTDLQMFALKTLQIPLPGRHPPSPLLPNGSANLGCPPFGELYEDWNLVLINGQHCCNLCRENHSRHDRLHLDFLESFQPLKPKPASRQVSPAMSSLQGYYGLSPNGSKGQAEGVEMAAYRLGVTKYSDKEQLPKPSTPSDLPPTRHRKSRSLANGNGLETGDYIEDLLMREAGSGEKERFGDLSVRIESHQKGSPDRGPSTPEMILKEDNTSGGFAGITGKGLAQRPKSASRAMLVAVADSGPVNPIPMADLSTVSDVNGGVRKSSSTSNLQASDNGTSIWVIPKWSLKTDLQALSAATLTRPVFDNLPRPSPPRRNKAALD